MLTLCVDTTSFVASVAFIEDNKIIFESNINYIRNHSIVLMPLIESMLDTLGKKVGDIDNICVAKGPGSFTGQRIGIASIMGIAKAIDCPIYPVNTLDMLKNNVQDRKIVVPIIDARRSEAYYAIYKDNERTTDYAIDGIDNILAVCKQLDEEVWFTGDAVSLHKDKILSMSDKFFVTDFTSTYQRAVHLFNEMKNTSAVKYDEVELFYMRKVEAEREYNAKSLKIVDLDKSHIDELVEIEKEWSEEAWTKKMFLDELEHSFAKYFVAIIDDKVVGYVGTWHIINECQIINIAIEKSFRRQNLGDKLMEYAIEYYKQFEAIGMTLEVRKSNLPAITFYKKHGFEVEGERKNFYANGEDAYIMWLKLSDDCEV